MRKIVFLIVKIFLSTNVIGTRLRFVGDVQWELKCGVEPRFIPDCGHYIQDRQHSCWSDSNSEQLCQYQSTSDGDRGDDLYCVPINCLVRKNTKSHCVTGMCGPSAVSRSPYDPVNFLVANGEGCTNRRPQKCIKVKGYRISCQSDTYKQAQNYGGIIVYDAGTYPGVLPGYTVLAHITDQKLKDYRALMKRSGERAEGQVHGYTIYKRFKQSPTKLMRKYGMKFAGFAFRNGKVEFTSGTLNARSEAWKHAVSNMVEDERVVVNGLMKAWVQNGIARTYYADSKRRDSLIPYICQGLVELPKTKAFVYSSTYYPECKATYDSHFD